MELVKNKYKKQEVLEITQNLIKEFEEKISLIEKENEKLSEERNRLKGEIETYKNRDRLNEEMVAVAKKKAEELVETAMLKYSAEIEYLKNFNSKWRKYFKYLSETYPYYKAKEESDKVSKALTKILGKKSEDKEIITELDDIFESNIKTKANFEASSKIGCYFGETAISSNGFNMDEVLNPGELDLGELCKEMGIMEE